MMRQSNAITAEASTGLPVESVSHSPLANRSPPAGVESPVMNRRTPVILVAVFALALAGAALAGVASHRGATRTKIVVTEREFRIHLSTTKTAPGTVTFVVKDIGTFRHALAISGPGVKLKRTPLIHPGKSVRLVVKLRAGTYSLWCPVPGHAAQGMKATLHVAGAGGSTSTSGGSTSTSGGGSGGGGWG